MVFSSVWALLRVTVAQTLKIKPLPLPWKITAGQNLHMWRIWQRKETENKELESYKGNEGIDTTNSELIPLYLPHPHPVGVAASRNDITTYTNRGQEALRLGTQEPLGGSTNKESKFIVFILDDN